MGGAVSTSAYTVAGAQLCNLNQDFDFVFRLRCCRAHRLLSARPAANAVSRCAGTRGGGGRGRVRVSR